MPSARFIDRRTLLRGSAGVAATVPMAFSPWPIPRGSFFPCGSDRIRIGVVGCGGRGTGAAAEAVEAALATGDRGVAITALGDLVPSAIEQAAGMLAGRLGDGFDAPSGGRFTGPDACERVCGSGVDVVILAGPAAARPAQVAMAVGRGLHVYAERPFAVDGEGLAVVAAAGRTAADGGLSFVTSLAARYDAGIAAAVGRVQGLGGRVREVVAHELAGGLAAERCIDAIDVAMAACGGHGAACMADWRIRSTAGGVLLRRDDGPEIRVLFDESAASHGRMIVRHSAGDFEFITPADRRRASANGLAAAWAAFLSSIRRSSPINDSLDACRAHAAAFAAAGRAAGGVSAAPLPSPLSETA